MTEPNVRIVACPACKALNRVPAARCRWVAARVETALARADAFDTVVLDPPREGCSAAVSQRLFGELRPSLAVYVSCNPEALASELPAILKAGYRINDVRAVDMFPHTDHIEAVVLLSRRD